MENLEKRGVDAAAAYLKRIDMTVFEKLDDAVLAVDGEVGDEVLVYVDVFTVEGVMPPRNLSQKDLGVKLNKYKDAQDTGAKAILDGMPVRFDSIELSVLAEDRALLRHHRNVGYDEPTEVP